VNSERRSYCTSCYTGVYPVPFPRDEASYLQLALKLQTLETSQLDSMIEAVPDQMRQRIRSTTFPRLCPPSTYACASATSSRS